MQTEMEIRFWTFKHKK